MATPTCASFHPARHAARRLRRAHRHRGQGEASTASRAAGEVIGSRGARLNRARGLFTQRLRKKPAPRSSDGGRSARYRKTWKPACLVKLPRRSDRHDRVEADLKATRTSPCA